MTRVLSFDWLNSTQEQQNRIAQTGNWRMEEAHVYMYMECSTENIHDVLKNAGWDFELLLMPVGYARRFYELVKATIAKFGRASILNLVDDFSRSSLEEHGSPVKRWE